jgi:hypothetical protein
MISDALAAFALSGAGFIGAVAVGLIGVYIAFHKDSLLSVALSYFLR